LRDGKLLTTSGEELKPSADFQAVAQKMARPSTTNERLMRRGQ
jgi:hypothetical protein